MVCLSPVSPYPTGDKHTISTCVDQTHSQPWSIMNGLSFKTSLYQAPSWGLIFILCVPPIYSILLEMIWAFKFLLSLIDGNLITGMAMRHSTHLFEAWQDLDNAQKPKTPDSFFVTESRFSLLFVLLSLFFPFLSWPLIALTTDPKYIDFAFICKLAIIASKRMTGWSAKFSTVLYENF